MQKKRRYRLKTWYDPRLEARLSPIQGHGMFATQAIQEGEIVVINGGMVLSDAEFQAYIANLSRYNAIQIGEDAHMVEIYAIPDKLIGGMNHSCDANLWMSDEVTFVARRAIAAGEEVTVDYALFTTIPHWYWNSHAAAVRQHADRPLVVVIGKERMSRRDTGIISRHLSMSVLE